MGRDLFEIEKEFRDSWSCFDPNRYAAFLEQANDGDRLELLARIIGAELEYNYQPPIATRNLETSDKRDGDDERVRPSLALFALRFPELTENSRIMIQLAVTEYANRLKYDSESPRAEEYLELCPNQVDHLFRVLNQTDDCLRSARSHATEDPAIATSDLTVKDDSESVSVSIEPLPSNLGCFLLTRLISRGGMGLVYSAIDLRSTVPMAVKVMRRDDSWSVYRFIEEFSWLSRVSHPNLVRLYDAFSEGDFRYFSMELVEGRTIRDWFSKAKGKSRNIWRALRTVLAQTASAIQFLHENAIIHCDIKCSNVMITSRRRAVLLDLGLAVREGSPESGLGTLQYSAPEVIDNGNHSRSSDWYSFGMMIYELLSKEGNTLPTSTERENSEAKRGLDSERLRQQLQGCDDQLVDLCCKLLQPNPRDRIDGSTVLSLLGGSVILDLTTTQFEGRSSTFAELDAAYERSSLTERAGLVILRGESGIGKTTVLRNWMLTQQKPQHFAFTMRCFQQDHTPQRLVNATVQELIQVLSTEPEYLWRPSFDTYVEDISLAFPQVRQLTESGFSFRGGVSAKSNSYQDKATGRKQLARWIAEISQQRPVLIVIDDCQWADEESIAWLADLLRDNRFRGLLIAVDESEVPSVQPKLHARWSSADDASSTWVGTKTIDSIDEMVVEVAALSLETCERLLSQWGDLSGISVTKAVKSNIVERAQGSPFLLQELFRAYAHYSKRDGISDGDWLDTDSQKSVRRRFSMLPIQSENVLQYLAVAGQPIGFHQLQMVSRIMPDELQRTLNYLASQGWVRSKFKDFETDIEITHERFRRVIMDSLPPDRLHRRHFRMARMLSSEVPPPWSRMGDHYWSAQRFREAAACYREAARAAAKSGSYELALKFLERAQHQAADRTGAELDEFQLLHAECLAWHGNASEAAVIYDKLSENAADDEKSLLYSCLAGEQWIRGGHLDNGLERFGKLLHRLGFTSLRKTPLSQLKLRFRTLVTTLSESPAQFQYAPKESFDELETSLCRVCIPLTFLDNQLGPDLILQFRRKVADSGSLADQATALLHWGILLTFGNRHWRRTAAKWLRLGRDMAKASKLPVAVGDAKMALFIRYAQMGRSRLAVTHAERGLECYLGEPRNMHWEIQFLRWGVLLCKWEMMRLKDMRANAVDFQSQAADRSDPMSKFLTNVVAHWTHFIVDDTEQARNSLDIAERAISNQTFQSPRFFLWLSRIQLALYEGRPREAHEIMLEDWGYLAKAYVFGNNHYHWLALRARMCCNLAMLRSNPRDARRFHRDAQKSVKAMLKLEEPPFIAHGRAFQLVTDACSGSIAPMSTWERVAGELHRWDHHLCANGLRWHQSLYAPPEDRSGMESEVRQRFESEGCVAPEKLLELILPLPEFAK